MKRRIEPSLPPQVEWDFRPVPDEALPDATLWEYARSCPPVRKAVEKWLASKIEGKTVREHLLAAAQPGIRALIDGVPRDVAGKLFRRGQRPREIPTGVFLLTIEMRADFPAPWLAAPVEYERNPNAHPRFLCTPLAGALELLRQHPTLAETYASPGRHWHMSIDWEGATQAEILENFRRWLAREARKHRAAMKRGRAAQSPTWALKHLAAWRLSKAGFSFGAGQEEARKFFDGGVLIPTFEEKAKWHKAIAGVEKTLATLAGTGRWEVAF